jgi:hypothetical protein
MKTKKQRLPRKLKKEMKKLKRIGVMQLHYGTRKGFGMNKWTWKLYCLCCRWFKNIQQQHLHIAQQGTSSKSNPHFYSFRNNCKW